MSTYRVDVVADADQQLVTNVGIVRFVIDHDTLVANPDFSEGYRIIRDLARNGLQSVAPEYVSET